MTAAQLDTGAETEPETRQPKIEIRGLGKRFGGNVVLNGLDLDVKLGESLVIIGGSGTGKSVLLKCILGLLKPDSGSIKVDGTELGELSSRERDTVMRKFGMLFQGAALFDSLPVWENVSFGLMAIRDIARKDAKDVAVANLAKVGLGAPVADLYPAELSGGMKKRVALARAIALTPQYIIYDEPTSGLDPETSNTINDLIRSLSSRSNVTSIVVTHDMHSVLAIADRAAFIHDCAIHWVGTIEEMHAADEPTLNAFVRASEYQVGAPDRTASP